MKYQVPQFIEVEDKIFGPFTFKQFVFMIGGAGLSFIAYRFFPIYVSVLIILPVVAVSGMLAFYRPNNRPFIDTLEAAFNFALSHKLYIWRKEDKKISAKDKDIIEMTKTSISVPKLSESKLKDLTWSLDINETIYSKDTGKLQSRDGAMPRNHF